MSRIVDIEPLLKKYDGMNEGTEFSPIHFINDLMALEQLLFNEKEELLRVSKGAVKARQGRFVIYDVDWLKENFYTTEEKIYGQPKQTCIEDYPTCTECEHYDKEKHYCPRFCQVIKDTLAEAQPKKGKWIKVITDIDEWGETWHFKCSICGEKSNKGYRPLENYCHNCGAEMIGGEEDGS